MKKVLNKVLAVLTLLTLVGINFVTDVAYASNIIAESNNNKKEIEFDARIGESYSTEADVESEIALNLSLEVNKGGYLKDVKVTLDNSNYIISKTAEEINKVLLKDSEITSGNIIVKGINDNVIYLKEVDFGEKLEVAIPIKFEKKVRNSVDYFDRDSNVVVTATYVNEKNKEQAYTKTVTEHIKWVSKAEGEISQKLVRYLKYDNKTMVSFEINDQIKNNSIPFVKKEVSITVPRLNNQEPEYISTTGDIDSKEYKNGILNIVTEKEADESNSYGWNTSNQYTVTYIYNTQSNEKSISSTAKERITTINNNTVLAETKQVDFETNEEIGTVVGLETKAQNEINKGYLYTNLNRNKSKLNTQFNTEYKVNVGYSELTNKILLQESNAIIKDENDNEIENITEKIKTTKISISTNEIEQVVGDEGKIIIKDNQNRIIGELSEEKNELNVDCNIVYFEITNLKSEGNLTFKLQKEILGANDYTIETIKSFKKLLINTEIKGYKDNAQISGTTSSTEINLTEPTSKASFDVNTNNLSTVVTNNNVVFNIVLHRTNISDALYVNPKLKITLPSEINSIKVTSAKIIYDKEINAGKVDINGNEINISLNGTQTTYNTLTTTKGSLIRVVADLGLDMLSPSKDTKFKVEYSNEFTSETKSIEKAVHISAPSQIITTNEIRIDDQSAYAVDNDAELLKLKTGESSKEMQVIAQIINNIGSKAEGIEIIGRIPSSGNRTIGGKKLESNIETSMQTPIEIAGIKDATVYYSNNIEEDVNGKGWTTEFSNQAKSFKITSKSGLEDKTLSGFRYTVTVPENLNYEQILQENYGMYYSSGDQDGVRLVESKIVGAETGIEPNIRLGITASDTNQGYAIDDGGSVTEGEFITYKVKVANIGSFEAENVKIKAIVPDEMTLVDQVSGTIIDPMKYYVFDSSIKTIEQEVGTLQGGESQIYEFTVQINQNIENLSNEAKKLTVKLEAEANILEEKINSTFTVNNTEGSLNIKLTSDADTYIKPGQEINYLMRVANSNSNSKENVNLKVKLPEGLKYTGISNEYADKVNYNKSNNEVSINMETVEGGNIELIEIQAVNELEENKEIKTKATLSFDGAKEEIESNTITNINESAKNTIQTKQTVNNSNNLTDKDEIEFYTDISNSASRTQSIVFEDNIQKELDVIEYRVTVNGKVITKGETNYIREIINLQPGEFANVTIKVKPYLAEQGTQINIENKPIITNSNNEQISVNSINLTIDGTNEIQSDEIVEEGIKENSEIKEKNETYRISGNVWYDQNKDGIKDVNESKFSNVTIKLYDAVTKDIAKNENGDQITTTTDEEGNYVFTNLNSGEYIVIAIFNNTKYEIGNYHADNVDESLNSDFVSAQLDGENIAATDIQKITDTNLFNIDLGLAKIEEFNLNISQNISKITVTGENNNSKVYNFNKNSAQIELSQNELKNSTILVEYNIQIENRGDIEGYAKTIISYLPNGMTFNSELNPDWYLGQDGNLYTISIANEAIKPGESKNITLILTKKMNVDSTGIFRGKSEIKSTYNERGLEEINALAYSSINGESNLTTSNVIILKKSKARIAWVIVLTIALISLIGFGGYELKKRVFDKMYNYDDLDM